MYVFNIKTYRVIGQLANGKKFVEVLTLIINSVSETEKFSNIDKWGCTLYMNMLLQSIKI